MRKGRQPRPAAVRLIEKTERDPITGCWNFTGFVRHDGYGVFCMSVNPQKNEMAHRASYNLFVGPFDPSWDIHHECENRRCINPSHLKALPKRRHYAETPSNSRAWTRAQQTHCIHGHEFTPENIAPARFAESGTRDCLTCKRQHAREWAARHREQERARKREHMRQKRAKSHADHNSA